MKAVVLSAGAAQLVHLVFEWCALACGMQLYRMQSRHTGAAGLLQPGGYGVVIGCLLGAGMGNKLVFWIEFPHLWQSYAFDVATWMAGQSIVGGLLGGLIGIEIAKKLMGVRRSTGDNFVLPIVAGTVVGRIGCFLAGLHDGTYGDPASLAWAVDFGDGIPRHPTQLYDIAFVLLWGGLLLHMKQHLAGKPGLLFKLYLSGYLMWRIAVDGIKPIPYAYFGYLSGIQLVSLLALACYLPIVARQFFSQAAMRQHPASSDATRP
jgi:phosphatidylglycerol---prolipoprotein diacylglyceryl transferase